MTLRELRLNKRFTLREVTDDLGLTLSSLSKWETGRDTMPEKYLVIFKDYYKVDSIELPKINKIKADCEKYKTLYAKYLDLYINMVSKYNNIIKNIKHYKKSLQEIIDLKLENGE